MKPRRRALIIVCLAVLLAASACAYRTTSRGRSLHGRIAVPFLDNRTGQPDLEVQLTEALVEALEQDGNLEVVSPGDEDFLLQGAVTRYTEAPFSISAEGVADEYKLSIAIVVSFVDQTGQQRGWRDKRVTGSANFYIESSAAGEELTRAGAEVRALEQIVEDILDAIFGEW
ncbi:MAG: LptE family protein [Candidatus Krumholzibacteriota bacterium]|nr:LptE family protein [Candidatus Krumholzibacteriota bacterium]